jgi:hypothetical protein
MKELISLADAYLNYRRGKESGLAGLIGFICVGLGIYFWDEISAFSKWIGFTAFLQKHGFIAEEAGITALRIFMGFFFLCILIVTVLAIGLLLMMIVFMIGQNQVAISIIKFVVKWSFYILFSPLIILYQLNKARLRAKAGKLNLGDLLAQKNREMTLEEVKEYLNFLPHPFGKDQEPLVVGLDWRNNLWVLFPRVQGYSYPNRFEGEKLKVKTEFSGITGQYHLVSLELDPERYSDKVFHSYKWTQDEEIRQFDRFFLPQDEKLLKAVRMVKAQDCYSRYAKNLVKGFFGWKDHQARLLEEDSATGCLSPEEYEYALRAVYQCNPRNQDEMRVICETDLRSYKIH